MSTPDAETFSETRRLRENESLDEVDTSVKEPILGPDPEYDPLVFEDDLDNEPDIASDYPKVPFDVDEDIKRSVLRSCTERIQGQFYLGHAHGVELVIDKSTAYFNASSIIPDENSLNELMESDVMKVNFDYIKSRLNRTPYYRVTDQENPQLDGVYMHGMVIGNVLGNAIDPDFKLSYDLSTDREAFARSKRAAIIRQRDRRDQEEGCQSAVRWACMAGLALVGIGFGVQIFGEQYERYKRYRHP
ncbi:hypothetical protein J6590_087496 [Homalodisca vitripennis]|nr:hypothetical protein J6590_087496 [Homalodisca vitripennis]